MARRRFVRERRLSHWQPNEEPESAISLFIKYALFFLNFLFWVVGLGLMIVGSWALATKELEQLKRATSVWDYVFDLTVIILVIGFVVFFVSTVGCVGALRENVVFLTIFWSVLLVIVLALLSVGIVGFALREKFLAVIKNELSPNLIKNYFEDSDLEDLINFVQFACCGMSDEGYLDWGKYNQYYFCGRTSNKDPRACSVPASCCLPDVREVSGLGNSMCGADVLTVSGPFVSERVFTVGCVGAAIGKAKQYATVVFGILLAISSLPIVQIGLACILCSQIREQKRRWYMTAPRRSGRQRRPISIV